MKISFNPLIRNNHQTVQNKTHKSNSSNSYMKRQSALECLANYNISFCRREVIVVHYDGSYERFPSAAAVEKKYGSGIRPVLSGVGYASGEVTCVYADECTMEDDEISPVCLKRILNNFSYASKRPIYAIDFYGNIQRFENRSDASEKLGISDATIYNILNDSTRAGDYIFVRAADVEKRDENFRLLYEDEGKPKIDIEAINQARTVFLCLSKKYPIVTIDVDGNTRIYKDTEAMAKEMGKKPKNIQGGVWAYQKYGNLVVLKLSEVVKRENGKVLFNEDGSFMLDEAKILEYRDAILLKK